MREGVRKAIAARAVAAAWIVAVLPWLGAGSLRAQAAQPRQLSPRLVEARLWPVSGRASALRIPGRPGVQRPATLATPAGRESGPIAGGPLLDIAEGRGDRQARDVPKSGAEVWIPLGSLLLPGLGQYSYGDLASGFGYSAVAVAGIVAAGEGSTDLATLPRRPSDQLAFEGAHVAFTAGALSAWDAFRRAGPALEGVGRYDFLGQRESLGELLTAPLDVRFLSRWTTLLDLGFSAAVAGWVLSDRDEDRSYEPFRGHDAAFIGSLSFNAAVGEEALFRGWLLPVLHQKLGRRFWLANGIQAALFGAGHVPQADDFALVIAASALYAGWLTRRNDWSVREVIFQHFWYDVLVGTAELLSDEAGPITLLPIRITF